MPHLQLVSGHAVGDRKRVYVLAVLQHHARQLLHRWRVQLLLLLLLLAAVTAAVHQVVLNALLLHLQHR